MTETCFYCGAKIITEKVPCPESKCSYLHIKTIALPQPDLTKLREVMKDHGEHADQYMRNIVYPIIVQAVKELLEKDKA